MQHMVLNTRSPQYMCFLLFVTLHHTAILNYQGLLDSLISNPLEFDWISITVICFPKYVEFLGIP